MTKSEHNEAFIDGQNLYLSTQRSKTPWTVDLFRFREYLRAKYHVEKAFYFIGCLEDGNDELYQMIQEAGFILVFRKQPAESISHKKGNVDTDIVFCIMKKLYSNEKIDKYYLVSGDGDYYRLVQFLRNENKLGKILFPSSHNASGLYRTIENKFRDFLDSKDIKKKIAYRKKLK